MARDDAALEHGAARQLQTHGKSNLTTIEALGFLDQEEKKKGTPKHPALLYCYGGALRATVVTLTHTPGDVGIKGRNLL